MTDRSCRRSVFRLVSEELGKVLEEVRLERVGDAQLPDALDRRDQLVEGQESTHLGQGPVPMNERRSANLLLYFASTLVGGDEVQSDRKVRLKGCAWAGRLSRTPLAVSDSGRDVHQRRADSRFMRPIVPAGSAVKATRSASS